LVVFFGKLDPSNVSKLLHVFTLRLGNFRYARYLAKVRVYNTLEVLLYVLVNAQTGVQEGVWFTVCENASQTKIGKYMDDA
jgi:hypothetical protein